MKEQVSEQIKTIYWINKKKAYKFSLIFFNQLCTYVDMTIHIKKNAD